jgi:hypothetical protein
MDFRFTHYLNIDVQRFVPLIKKVTLLRFTSIFVGRKIISNNNNIMLLTLFLLVIFALKVDKTVIFVTLTNTGHTLDII